LWLGEIVPGKDITADLIRIRDLYAKAGYRFPLEAADMGISENSEKNEAANL